MPIPCRSGEAQQAHNTLLSLLVLPAFTFLFYVQRLNAIVHIVKLGIKVRWVFSFGYSAAFSNLCFNILLITLELSVLVAEVVPYAAQNALTVGSDGMFDAIRRIGNIPFILFWPHRSEVRRHLHKWPAKRLLRLYGGLIVAKVEDKSVYEHFVGILVKPYRSHWGGLWCDVRWGTQALCNVT